MNNKPLKYPIDGTLDLHTFKPSEIKPLINDYIEECSKLGIIHLRIIHGKGTGTLRRIVHSVLEKNSHVVNYSLAGQDGGGWGATLVTLLNEKAP